MTNQPQQHEMYLHHIDDGVETWQCPDCPRRLLVTWQPFAAIAVVEGDTTFAHSGAKGGISMGRVEVVDPRLDVYDAWLADRYGDEN